VILLHGFTHDSRVWQPQLVGLADAYSVIAWDAPGAGRTADPPETYAIADWAEDLTSFMGAMDADVAHVLGLSWGGLLAQELYRQHPERVRSLVLADTYAGWTGSLGASIAEERLTAALGDSLLPPAEFVAKYLPGMFSESPPPGAWDALAAIMAEFHPAGFRLMATALARADTRDLLPTIRTPTLLLWGDRDIRSPLSVAHQFHDAIPAAELVVLTGAGHISNLEQPDAFTTAARDFWSSFER
jgi:pimeloyl-ACP methyl ester carboxylesterase